MKITVVCQVCFEKIATTDTDELRVPIRGAMFHSKDPDHGFPAPFAPGAEWQFMKCPYGNHRPFFVVDVIPYYSGEARNPKLFKIGEPWEEEKVQVFPELAKEEEQKPVVVRKRGRKPKKSIRETILEDVDDIRGDIYRDAVRGTINESG